MREIQQQLGTWESSQHAQDSVPAIPTESNLHHQYKCQSVNVLQGNNRCFLRELYKAHKRTAQQNPERLNVSERGILIYH